MGVTKGTQEITFDDSNSGLKHFFDLSFVNLYMFIILKNLYLDFLISTITKTYKKNMNCM